MSADEREEGSGRKERSSLKITHEATVSCEAALDTNARRQQTGGAVEPDALAYVYASGRLEGRRPGRQMSAALDLGGKRFARTNAEDTVVGRLSLRWAGVFGPGVVLGAEGSYKDKLQRGDPWRGVEGDPDLACRPPTEDGSDGYRCNRRDYRQGAVVGSFEKRHGSWTLRGRGGASLFDYKPNRQFSYGGPDMSLAVGRPLGERHSLQARVGASRRHYHSDSVTYRVVPSGGSIVVQEIAEPRVEGVLSGAFGWRYRGPVLLSGNVVLASSRNNGDGMDVFRARAEVTGAMRLGSSTTLVASGAFQIAHYPDGNVFRRISLLGDEDERQNSVALQATRRLTDSVSLVIKVQAFANEFSGDTLPFRRQVAHGGFRWSM